jgi:hypothetical protein
MQNGVVNWQGEKLKEDQKDAAKWGLKIAITADTTWSFLRMSSDLCLQQH